MQPQASLLGGQTYSIRATGFACPGWSSRFVKGARARDMPEPPNCLIQPVAQTPTCLASRDGAFYEPVASQVCAGLGGAEQQSHDAHRVESRNMRHRTICDRLDYAVKLKQAGDHVGSGDL